MLIAVAAVLVKERFATVLSETNQHLFIDRHDPQRGLEILIGDGEAILQASVAGAEDHKDVRRLGFLQFLIGPGIYRPAHAELIVRRDDPLDLIPLVRGWLEVRPFTGREKSFKLYLQFLSVPLVTLAGKGGRP